MEDFLRGYWVSTGVARCVPALSELFGPIGRSRRYSTARKPKYPKPTCISWDRKYGPVWVSCCHETDH